MSRFYKKIKNNKGFSLAEVLIVVAIIGIIAAVSIIALIEHQRRFNQTKQDEYAKSLYYSASNQSLELSSSGIWTDLLADDSLPLDFWGAPMKNLVTPGDFEFMKANAGLTITWSDVWDDMYYLESSHGSNLTTSSILGYMLPLGSVDETIRSDGTFFIEYNRKTASVYAAWFTDSKNEVTYVYDIVSENGLNEKGRPSDTVGKGAAFDARKTHKAQNNRLTQIGYYGGIGIDARDFDVVALSPVALAAKNGEDLSVELRDPNVSYNCNVRFEITGLTSKNKAIIVPNITDGTYVSDKATSTYKNDGVIYTETSTLKSTDIILDSIVDRGGHEYGVDNLHFYAVCCFGEDALIPGENIEVKVICIPKDVLALPVTATISINSLFHSVRGTAAEISQIRHLENLNPDISALGITINTAKLVKNLSFDDVRYCGEGSEDSVKRVTMGIADVNAKDYSDAYITGYTGSHFVKYNVGSYIPVYNEDLLTFDGQDHLIYNLRSSTNTTDGTDALGIFSSFNPMSTSGAYIKNTGLISYGWSDGSQTAEVHASFSGSGYVGGIAGEIKDTTISRCFVNMKLANRASAGAGFDLATGGITAHSKGNAQISDCYSGGHTYEGTYDYTESGADFFIKNESGNGEYTGGIIGYADDGTTTLRNCFTTVSYLDSKGCGSDRVFADESNITTSSCYAINDGTYINEYPETELGYASGFLRTFVYDDTLYGKTYPYENPTGLGYFYGDWNLEPMPVALTYEIRVTNPAPDTRTFDVYDIIPEGLTYTEDNMPEYHTDSSATADTFNGAGRIDWKVSIEGGKTWTALVSFLPKEGYEKVSNYVYIGIDGFYDRSETVLVDLSDIS